MLQKEAEREDLSVTARLDVLSLKETKVERTILNPVEPSKVTRRFSTRDNVVCTQGILRCWERDRPDGRPSIFEAFDDGAQGAGNTGF